MKIKRLDVNAQMPGVVMEAGLLGRTCVASVKSTPPSPPPHHAAGEWTCSGRTPIATSRPASAWSQGTEETTRRNSGT